MSFPTATKHGTTHADCLLSRCPRYSTRNPGASPHDIKTAKHFIEGVVRDCSAGKKEPSMYTELSTFLVPTRTLLVLIPSTLSSNFSACPCIFSASLHLPCLLNTSARLFMLLSVSGCSAQHRCQIVHALKRIRMLYSTPILDYSYSSACQDAPSPAPFPSTPVLIDTSLRPLYTYLNYLTPRLDYLYSSAC